MTGPEPVPLGVRWHRCIRHALTGAALGFAYAAWAQEPTQAADSGMLVELVRVGGLPGVIAWVAWTASRAWAGWVPMLRLVVILDPPQRDASTPLTYRK